MQLSAFPPIVVPQPAAYQQPGSDSNSGTPSGNNGTPFAQLLPVAAPASAPAAAQPAAGAKTEKKLDSPTESAEEETAAIYGSWLAAVMPQPSPVVVPGKLAAASPAVDGIGVKKLPAAAASLPGTAALSATGASSSAATRGTSQLTPTPHLTGAPAAATVPAGPANAAPTRAQPAAASKPAATPASSKTTSPSSVPAKLASDAAVPDTATSETTSDAATPVKAAKQLGAAAVDGAEKIAGSPPNAASTPAAISKSQDKKILTADSKSVTESSEPVGIGVAKVAPVMPTAAPNERPPSAMVAPVPVLAGSSVSNQPAGTTPGPVSQQGVAQNAVDAAITAAERLSTGNQQAVNLQFSVGNADLSLRVELKNGEIHTTFRTDSADLRLDLQHEWQSANPGSGSGSVKLAEPIFTSSGNAASSAAGENAQHRGGQARQDSSSSPSGSPSFGSRATTSVTEAESPARAPVSHSTSLHLQAFA